MNIIINFLNNNQCYWSYINIRSSIVRSDLVNFNEFSSNNGHERAPKSRWSNDQPISSWRHGGTHVASVTQWLFLLEAKKSHPTVHPLPCAISWLELGWAAPDCFQQVCQLLFQSVLMRGGTGHCSNPKNGWTMTLRPLHCAAITTPITLSSMRTRERENEKDREKKRMLERERERERDLDGLRINPTNPNGS